MVFNYFIFYDDYYKEFNRHQAGKILCSRTLARP